MTVITNDPFARGPSLQLGKVNSFLSLTTLKYYFAVDTVYVLKKLGIVVFPFSHRVSQSRAASVSTLPVKASNGACMYASI